MKIHFGLILSTVLIIACNTANQKPNANQNSMTIPEQLPMEDFFRNPEKSGYQISPNGTHFAYMAPTAENRMNVFVQAIGGDSAKQLTSETERDIYWFFWANNNRIIYLKDFGGDENIALYAVDIDGKNFNALTEIEGVKTQIIDELEDIEDYMLIGLNQRNAQVFDPYRININTGEMEMLYENPGNWSGWMTDHAGKLRIASQTDGVNTTLLYRATEDDAFEPALTTNFKEGFNPQFFDFDNGSVIYGTSNLGRDKSALVTFDMETGKELDVLFQDDYNDIMGASYSKKRKVLTTVSWYAEKRKRHFFDDETETIYRNIQNELPDVEVAITSMNKAEDKFIIRTYSDKTRGAYYYYDKNDKALTLIDEISPWLNASEMADMKPISYKSRDGLTIHGYLTLPKGKEATNLPVVVNPHGGPWARDYWGFNPEVQFLANRGYAVLQMNFRGSTSYGKAFWEKSFKQWGQTMQNDVSDGVKWLIDEGIADSNRIAIYGGSYGGYATLAGLTYTPNLYACGIDYVGVSNLFTFLETIPPYWKPYLEMMYEMVGHPETDSAMLAAYSPALNAEKINAPLFVAQGANDPRVKQSESDQMVEALKARGITVDYMVKDNEGHGFYNEENRFDFYGKMETFLKEHIGS